MEPVIAEQIARLKEVWSAESAKYLDAAVQRCAGIGRNLPHMLLVHQDAQYPVLIVCKDSLVKLDRNGHVENRTSRNTLHAKNIKTFAVNGAVFCSNAVLHYTGTAM